MFSVDLAMIILLFTEPPSIATLLTQEEISIATSLWPFQVENLMRKELNKYQKSALDIACSNTFTLVQGPPGELVST